MKATDVELFVAMFVMCFVTGLGVSMTIYWRRRLKRATEVMVKATKEMAEDAALADWARRTTLTVVRKDGMVEAYTLDQLRMTWPRQYLWADPVTAQIHTRSMHETIPFDRARWEAGRG